MPSSEQLVNELAGILENNGYGRVVNISLQKIAEEFFSPERINEQVNEIKRYTTLEKGKKILELGSGYGTLVIKLKLMEMDITGLEASQDAFDSAFNFSKRHLDLYNLSEEIIKQGFGENMPFADNTFDIVYSTSVLEHVQDPEKVISEVIRVLKCDGTAILNFPNYGSWWEGHYGIIFPPYCPKWLFKIIVRLLNREASFVDTLQFINYIKLKRWLKPHKNIKIISFGQDVWEERVKSLSFSEWASLGKLKTIVNILHKLKLVSILIWLGKKLHWETPFILVIKKVE